MIPTVKLSKCIFVIGIVVFAWIGSVGSGVAGSLLTWEKPVPNSGLVFSGVLSNCDTPQPDTFRGEAFLSGDDGGIRVDLRCENVEISFLPGLVHPNIVDVEKVISCKGRLYPKGDECQDITSEQLIELILTWENRDQKLVFQRVSCVGGRTTEHCEFGVPVSVSPRTYIQTPFTIYAEEIDCHPFDDEEERTIIIDSDQSEITAQFSPGDWIHLICKAEAGEKIWVILEVPRSIPGIQFARANDGYCREHGRYAFIFSIGGALSSEAQNLCFAESYDSAKIDFGVNDFSGMGEVIITVKKGDSPATLQTIQTIRLVEVP
jgi:hypothetical protein